MRNFVYKDKFVTRNCVIKDLFVRNFVILNMSGLVIV
jgi:hypothetical protein